MVTFTKKNIFSTWKTIFSVLRVSFLIYAIYLKRLGFSYNYKQNWRRTSFFIVFPSLARLDLRNLGIEKSNKNGIFWCGSKINKRHIDILLVKLFSKLDPEETDEYLFIGSWFDDQLTAESTSMTITIDTNTNALASSNTNVTDTPLISTNVQLLSNCCVDNNNSAEDVFC